MFVKCLDIIKSKQIYLLKNTHTIKCSLNQMPEPDPDQNVEIECYNPITYSPLKSGVRFSANAAIPSF